MGGFAMQLVQAADICTPCVYRVDCVPLNPIVASVLSVIPYTHALAWYFWDHLPPPKILAYAFCPCLSKLRAKPSRFKESTCCVQAMAWKLHVVR